MDTLAEIRAAIVDGVRQQIRAQQAQQGITPAPGAASSAKTLLGAGSEPDHDFAFATGYDTVTGLTTLPFTFGISSWGDGDIWSGS
jgi:hypothetical protein